LFFPYFPLPIAFFFFPTHASHIYHLFECELRRQSKMERKNTKPMMAMTVVVTKNYFATLATVSNLHLPLLRRHYVVYNFHSSLLLTEI
jgi:hypothetical protein